MPWRSSRALLRTSVGSGSRSGRSRRPAGRCGSAVAGRRDPRRRRIEFQPPSEKAPVDLADVFRRVGARGPRASAPKHATGRKARRSPTPRGRIARSAQPRRHAAGCQAKRRGGGRIARLLHEPAHATDPLDGRRAGGVVPHTAVFRSRHGPPLAAVLPPSRAAATGVSAARRPAARAGIGPAAGGGPGNARRPVGDAGIGQPLGPYRHQPPRPPDPGQHDVLEADRRRGGLGRLRRTVLDVDAVSRLGGDVLCGVACPLGGRLLGRTLRPADRPADRQQVGPRRMELFRRPRADAATGRARRS